MKRLHLILLAVFLILGQASSLEHAYHEHQAEDVCDFCLSVKPLEHFVSGISLPELSNRTCRFQLDQNFEIFSLSFTSCFYARAPPAFI